MSDLESNLMAPLISEPDDEIDKLFLSDVPIEILEQSIKKQFDEPLVYRKKDYIKDFITKYEAAKENETTMDDEGSAEELHESFLVFISIIFEEYLDVGFNDLVNMSEEDQHDLIHFTYRFFIRNIKRNFINIICNEIDQNKEEIGADLEKRKDVTYITFKKEIDDELESSIISNMNVVVDKVINKIRDYDVMKFFEMCDSGEFSIETDFVRSGYENGDITGNFIEKYINMIDLYFRNELETKVRSHILKKYPTRKNKVESDDPPPSETDISEVDSEEIEENNE